MLFKIFVFFNITFYILSIFSYLSIYLPPHQFWPSAFFALFFPFFVIYNISLLILLAIKKSKYILFPIIFVFISLSFITNIVSIKINNNKAYSNKISVLSYNLSAFNIRKPYARELKDLKMKNKIQSNEFIKWIVNDNANIKFFQEFFSNSDDNELNVSSMLNSKGYYHAFSAKKFTYNSSRYGVAIFTKHKIINKGKVKSGEKIINRSVFCDVVFKSDTLRLINVHLLSTNLNLQLSKINNPIKKILMSLWIFKDTACKRSIDNSVLINFITESPYKVILAGDFNVTPHSYIYNSVSQYLKNCFKGKEWGFGPTYKSQFPIIRIDNIFIDKKFSVLDFETLGQVKFSDHLPIKATIAY